MERRYLLIIWNKNRSKGGVSMNLKAVGQRIQQARRNKNLTQEQLAEIVGLSPTHISVIERGGKPTKITNLVEIANALGVSADELLVDVLDNTAKAESNMIYEEMAGLSPKQQSLAMKLFRVIVEELKDV
jgi:transcriptional regulator with XRE-family HTH domain